MDMTNEGVAGWVWDPDLKLVRDDGKHEIELDLTARVYSGRFQAEFAWVYSDHHEPVGIAVFRDWNEENIPVYSPQWRANDHGGVDIPGSPHDYEPERGARLIVPDDPDFEAARSLLAAAYELDS